MGTLILKNSTIEILEKMMKSFLLIFCLLWVFFFPGFLVEAFEGARKEEERKTRDDFLF